MYLVTCPHEPVVIDSVAYCDGWQVTTSQPFDSLIDLFSFDLQTFAIIQTTCFVIFITSYAAGLALRQMGRI